MEEKFASLEELYQRLKPALRTKKNEMIRQKLPRMEEKEIWLNEIIKAFILSIK